MELIHAQNERIPVDAMEFGTRAIRKVLERFGEPWSGARRASTGAELSAR
jgi:hypothetical protein